MDNRLLVLPLPSNVNSRYQAVSTYLNDIVSPTNTDLTAVLTVLTTLNPTEAEEALNQLQPSNASATSMIMGGTMTKTLSTITNRLSYQCCDCETNVFWAEPFGFYVNQGTREGIVAYDSYSTGIMTGYSRCFGPVKAGIAGGFNYLHTRWAKNRGDADVWSIYLRGSTGYCVDGYFLDLSFLFVENFIGITRRISFGSINRQATSNHTGYAVSPHLATGYYFLLPQHHYLQPFTELYLQPFAELSYTYASDGAYTESGASSLNLKVQSKSDNFLRAEAGFRCKRVFVNKHNVFKPIVAVSWVLHQPFPGHFVSSMSNNTQRFSVLGYQDTENHVAASIYLDVTTTYGFRSSLKYTLEGGYRYLSHKGELFLGYEF